MQTKTQVSNISAFRLLNPPDASSSIPFLFLQTSPAPTSLQLHSAHRHELFFPTSYLIISSHVNVKFSLVSCLLFGFSLHALLVWCTAGNHPGTLAGSNQREKELKTKRKSWVKKSSRRKEKLRADTTRRSPSLQVQLHKLFQMCVQHFTSSANSSEPHSALNHYFASSYFCLFFVSFNSVSVSSELFKSSQAALFTCDEMFRGRNHTCATQHPDWWILQRITKHRGGNP